MRDGPQLMPAPGEGSTFDPADPAVIANPHASFARLRDRHPVCRTALGGREIWLLSRYADVQRVLDEPSTRMRPPGSGTPPSLGEGPAARMWRASLSMMDPPDHTRIRRVVSRAFTRRRAESLRPRIEVLVEGVFSGLEGRNEFDAVESLALPVPVRVICELLGLPEADWATLESWTPDFLRIFLPDALPPADLPRVDAACANFLDYFDALADERRRVPRDDVTSALVALEREGELGRDELVGTLRGLLTAGFETSAATISAALLGFANQPEQLTLLRSRPELVPNAVEEVLRWETPVRVQTRYLGVDLTLDGHVVPAGSAVWVLLGSANHDCRRFSAPERLDVARADLAHVAFGGGRHFCLGAYLARVELQTVFARCARRWQYVEVDPGGVVRRPSLQFPSLARLPVRVA